MKKLCLISARQDLINSVKEKLDNITISDTLNPDENYDLIVLTDYNNETDFSGKPTIRSHLSLLPAFNTKNPIKDAFLSGVKVTGITVNKVEKNDLSGMILAQYPVMIDCYTDYNQLEKELYSLENKLLPLVIKSVLEDKVFDIVDLLTDNKCGGCSGCGKCH